MRFESDLRVLKSLSASSDLVISVRAAVDCGRGRQGGFFNPAQIRSEKLKVSKWFDAYSRFFFQIQARYMQQLPKIPSNLIVYSSRASEQNLRCV